MGYYSELAIDEAYHEDSSYPSPLMQKIWRLEDLRDDLVEYGYTSEDCGRRLTDEEIKYALPCDLCSVFEIERAINLLLDELQKETAALSDSYEQIVPEGVAYNQLSLFELCPTALDAA